MYTLDQIKLATKTILGEAVYQAVVGHLFLYKAIQLAGEKAFADNITGGHAEVVRQTIKHVRDGGYLPAESEG
jgi:hypothetical protein